MTKDEFQERERELRINLYEKGRITEYANCVYELVREYNKK